MAVRRDGTALQKPYYGVFNGKFHVLADLRIVTVLYDPCLPGKCPDHILRQSAVSVFENLFLQIDNIIHAVFFPGDELFSQPFHNTDQRLIRIVCIRIDRKKDPCEIRIHHLLNNHGGSNLPVDQTMLLPVCHDAG